MSTHEFILGSSGFPVRWFGRFAVVNVPAGRGAVTAAAREQVAAAANGG